jgi:nitroreductase
MSTPTRRRLLRQSVLMGAGSALAVTPAPAAPANPTLETIHSLRTIHGNFLNKPIPEAALGEILHATVRAANASNMQSYSIVVVRDRAKMRQLCGYAGSCLLLYCADYNRSKATAAALGHSYVPDGTVGFVTSAMNTMLAAQTAVIAARSLGIDSLLTNGVHRGDMERIWKLLDLPQTHCFPLIALVLGYPDKEPEYLKGRLDGPGVVHQEKYHPLTKEEAAAIVSEYDDASRHLALNEDWRKTHKHYLDWFHQVWVGRAGAPPQQESQMSQLLKRSGFVG